MFGDGRLLNIAIMALALAGVAAFVAKKNGAAGALDTGGRTEAIYEMPLGDVHRSLEQAGLPPLVFGSQPVELKMEAWDPAKVSWIVMMNSGAEAMRFVAELTPVSDHATRVALSLKAPTSGALGNVEQRLDSKPGLRNMYVTAMNEQVAATLEHRPYRASVTYPAMMMATMGNIKDLKASMESAAAAMDRQDQNNIDKAYADEAAGRGPRPDRFPR